MLDDVELTSDIYSRELDQFINKYGAFVGILLNKNISCVTLFSTLMQDEELREVMTEICHYSWYDVVKHMSYRYPILHKSKKIRRVT